VSNIEPTLSEGKRQLFIKLRLEWGVSYDELDEHIYQVTHRRRNGDTWRNICIGRTKNPHATTLSIIDAFLATYDTPRAKRLRRQQYPAVRKAS
jgi:hypothetical protein